MFKYIPHTEQEIKEMLDVIGVSSIDDLFVDIPDEIKFKGDYDLENGLSELEVSSRIQGMANRNTACLVPFIGAGSYDHYIPSIIKHITSRSEFLTAYTPYQPEVSQGTLTYIYEYQSVMTSLTDMEVSNASLYDGFTGAAEAAMMMNNATRRNKVIISGAANPSYINVIKTYGHFRGFEVIVVPAKDGKTDFESIEGMIDKTLSGVFVQSPNYFGIVEDATELGEKLHGVKSLLTMLMNPLSLAIFKTPGEMGADIVCGDAQPFGIPMAFGGPYLGYMVTTKKLMRKMPGRICGQTTDIDGKRAFVLTLQAREQHIRREKANSNICSNQSLNALAATVFLSTMGRKGLQEMAMQNYQKAHYAYDKITNLKSFNKVYEADFFNEFVVKSDIAYDVVKEKLEAKGFIPGLDLGNNEILFCVTEKRTQQEIDRLVELLGEL